MDSTDSNEGTYIAVVPFHEKIPIRVQNEVNTLIDEGYDVTVFSWDRNGAFTDLADQFDFDVVRVPLDAPDGLGSLLFLPLYYLKLFQTMKNEPFDVVHCTNFLMLPFCIFIGKKVQIVYDQREMYSRKFTDFGIRPLEKTLESVFNRFEGALVNRVDCVLTVDSADDFLRKKYECNNDNVSVVYNAPKLERSVDADKVHDLEEEYEDEHLVTYVGQINEDKGLWVALEMMSVLNHRDDVRLLMIGQLQTSGDEVAEFIRSHGIEDNVEFIEWLPYEEMMAYLEISDVGLALHQPTKIFNSVSLGNGRKIPTYMFASVPVLAPDWGEIGDIVRKYDCGRLVDTSDPSAVADGVSYLLEHTEEAKEMGRNGRLAIEEEFNWDVEEQKVIDAYRSIT